MNQFVYLRLELKRHFKLLPYLIIGAVALSIVIGSVAFCVGQLMYYRKGNGVKTLAFASEDDSYTVQLVMSSLASAESLSSLYHVEKTTAKQAIDMALSNKALLGVVIPRNFMHSIMVGDNYPIRVYFSANTSIVTVIATELCIATQNTLKAAQAGAYTEYDFYSSQNEYEAEKTANTELNAEFLTRALLRDNIYNKEKLYATGSFDTDVYYISSGVVLVMLLLGCVFIIRANTNNTISLKLNQNGINIFMQYMVNMLCIFLMLFVIYASAIIIFSVINAFVKFNSSLSFIKAIANGILLCLCSSSIIAFLCGTTQNKLNSMLLLFIVTLSSAFISGAFLPSIFLPKTFSSLAKFMPTTYLMNCTGISFNGGLATGYILPIMFFSVGFTAIGVLIKYHILYHSCGQKNTKSNGNA